MTYTSSTVRIVRRVLALTTALAAMLAMRGSAHVSSGVNCASCHNSADTGMAIINFQTTTNLGAGLRKVFKVSPGQTAVIQLNVTNDFGGDYGLNINNLGGGGVNNSANHMVYTADPTWTSRSSGTYYTVGPTTTSPTIWTFNLAVRTNSPADFYTIQSQMAGLDGIGDMWSQQEAFYVQVTAAAPPAPTILAPQWSGNSFSLQVATTSGFTYFLEYKTNMSVAPWNPVSQTTGDGTTKTLTDPSVTDSLRVYRVRVQ